MNNERIITLTTDFGYKDPFVGEMKGVILSINPSVTLIDITHGIEPHNIEEGAFVIGSSYHYFPSGTIHIGVVDPGVGSERKPIIAHTNDHYFIGPDNGIFSHVMSSPEKVKVIHITEGKYMLLKDSPTFQGRDVFAPVAAWLSKGIAIEEFGHVINDFRRFEIPVPELREDMVLGEVVYIDRFGNIITNIKKEHLFKFGERFCLEIKGQLIQPLKHYSMAQDNNMYCLINSSNHLEVFVNKGSASRLFNIYRGEKAVVLKA
jgi:S-adenosylmethionine hydrolase